MTQQLRAMNESQYKLVKLFLDGFKISPKRLAKEWSVPIDEVFRVQLTVNYNVYQKDTTPGEDVIMAMGIK